MRKIEIEIGGIWVENPVMYLPGVVGAATLLEDKAPQTCQALWDTLPIEDRTIHAYSAGQAWRAAGNYKLVPEGVVENPAESLEPGDIVHLNMPHIPLLKIFMVYGNARPPVPLSIIAKVDENLDELIKMSRRILYEGPKNVTIRRRE